MSDEYFDYNIGETFNPDDFYTVDDPASYPPQADYSNEGTNYPTPESTQGPGGSPVNASYGNLPTIDWRSILKRLQGAGGKALNFASSDKGLAAILGALLAEKRPAYGGGATQGYAGPKQMTRTMAQGKYGPIARYAANGGLMQAYAQGGPVQMEDGGFVMTKRAVDGAGGPQGIQQLVPVRMIRGPGTGTSDDIPAVINGRRGQTPALLSNGEAYVPKPVVDGQGGAQQMYALMNKLQRRG